LKNLIYFVSKIKSLATVTAKYTIDYVQCLKKQTMLNIHTRE